MAQRVRLSYASPWPYASKGEAIHCAGRHYVARLACDKGVGEIVSASDFADKVEGWSPEDGKFFPPCPACGAKTGSTIHADDGKQLGGFFFKEGLRLTSVHEPPRHYSTARTKASPT
jgi:hypothetical protein